MVKKWLIRLSGAERSVPRCVASSKCWPCRVCCKHRLCAAVPVPVEQPTSRTTVPLEKLGETDLRRIPICAPARPFDDDVGSSFIRWNVVAWAGRQSRQAKHEKTVSRSPFLLGSLFYFLLPPLSRRLICGQIKRDEWITLLPLGFKPTSKPVVFSPDAVPVHTTQGDGRSEKKCA